MRRTLALGFGIALACLVSPAWADDSVTSYRAEHGVFANLGLYSALGYGGISYGKACRPGGADWGDESSSRAWNSERAVDFQGPQGRIIVGYWF